VYLTVTSIVLDFAPQVRKSYISSSKSGKNHIGLATSPELKTSGFPALFL